MAVKYVVTVTETGCSCHGGSYQTKRQTVYDLRYTVRDSLLNYRKVHRTFLPIAALFAPLLEFVSSPKNKNNLLNTDVFNRLLVRWKGLEPPTYWFVEWLGSMNIALSYEFGGIVKTFWRTFYVWRSSALFSRFPLWSKLWSENDN
jgi:hypothetical protein